MTLNYWMIVERSPKPNGVVGCSIPSCELFSLLDGNSSHVVPKNEIKCCSDDVIDFGSLE